MKPPATTASQIQRSSCCQVAPRTIVPPRANPQNSRHDWPTVRSRSVATATPSMRAALGFAGVTSKCGSGQSGWPGTRPRRRLAAPEGKAPTSASTSRTKALSKPGRGEGAVRDAEFGLVDPLTMARALSGQATLRGKWPRWLCLASPCSSTVEERITPSHCTSSRNAGAPRVGVTRGGWRVLTPRRWA